MIRWFVNNEGLGSSEILEEKLKNAAIAHHSTSGLDKVGSASKGLMHRAALIGLNPARIREASCAAMRRHTLQNIVN